MTVIIEAMKQVRRTLEAMQYIQSQYKKDHNFVVDYVMM